MKMKSYDLHGKRLKEAEDLFYEILNEVRMKREPLEVNFITGTGVIQNRYKEMAAEQDLNAHIPMANRGCIVVEFE
jgi:hypothetical protein